jgi:hypothetical protein
MKEEILGGIQNSLERGETLDKAVKSFINAGYNPQEVNSAADMIRSGASPFITSPSPREEKPTFSEKPKKSLFSKFFSKSKNQNPPTLAKKSPIKNENLQTLNQQKDQRKKSKTKLIIILIIILAIIFLGIFGFVFFGEELLSTLFG